MGSPDPTSLGVTGVWTSAQQLAARSGSASSNVTPITFTTSGVSHGYSTGDTVAITGVNGAVNTNGVWEITVINSDTFSLNGSVSGGVASGSPTCRKVNNCIVRLSAPVTQNVALHGEFPAWTASANVTTAITTTAGRFKEHRSSLTVTIGTAFTTGKAAYYTLPSTLNLSDYQQLSYWVSRQSGAGGSNAFSLRLCSDTLGNVTVDTIPFRHNTGSTAITAQTVDNGSALGSNINSIALYVDTDAGAYTFDIDNIIACKSPSAADCLTLNSLIGKNTTSEQWWSIMSINGTRVYLDHWNSTPLSGTARGYHGVSETVTTYARQTINLVNHGQGTTFAVINEGGTAGNPISYSGGWNRTDMSTQTGETWYDFGNTSTGLQQLTAGISNYSFTKFGFARANVGVDTTVANTANFTYDIAFSSCNTCFRFGSNPLSAGVSITLSANSSTTGMQMGTGTNSVTDRVHNVAFTQPLRFTACGVAFTHNIQNGYYSTGNSFPNLIVRNCTTGFTTTRTLNYTFTDAQFLGCDTPVTWSTIDDFNSPNYTFKNCTFDTRLTVANPINLRLHGGSYESIFGTLTSGTISDSPPSYAWSNNIEANNIVITGTTEVGRQTLMANGRLLSNNHDNTAGNHKIFTDGGLISSATDQRNTASGISWKLQPTSTNRSSAYPLDLSLAKVAVAANSLVTIKAWMRRDNTGLTMRLVCKGGQIAGVSSDVVESMSAAANTWQELTITFTPTEAGVVEITAEAFGGSTFSGWVDDMTITQA